MSFLEANGKKNCVAMVCMSECLNSSEVFHGTVSRKCRLNESLFEQPKMVATRVFACIFVAPSLVGSY